MSLHPSQNHLGLANAKSVKLQTSTPWSPAQGLPLPPCSLHQAKACITDLLPHGLDDAQCTTQMGGAYRHHSVCLSEADAEMLPLEANAGLNPSHLGWTVIICALSTGCSMKGLLLPTDTFPAANDSSFQVQPPSPMNAGPHGEAFRVH